MTGLIALDVGASTGGFTDCLLQHGASRVYAVDVGYGQLDYRLRNDERVVVMERTNIRELAELPESPDIATIDASFIGLEKVLPAVMKLLKPGGRIVALVKPQFQAKRSEVRQGRRGEGPAHARRSHRPHGRLGGGQRPALRRPDDVAAAGPRRQQGVLRAVDGPSMNKVGCCYHPKLAGNAGERLARELLEIAARRVDATWLAPAWDEEAMRAELPDTDLLLCVGGDGTVLRAARAVVPHQTLLLGVNMGRLGFLTELDANEARDRLPEVLDGAGRVEQRAMLHAEIETPNGGGAPPDLAHHDALNDVVIGRATLGRTVQIAVSVDGTRSPSTARTA